MTAIEMYLPPLDSERETAQRAQVPCSEGDKEE
jgi:hypothetical protein